MSALNSAWAELWAEAKRADMLDLARRLGARLKKTAACHWTGPCPLGCASEDGFVVSQKKGFLCRPSGAHGDAVDMAMHISGGTRKEALAYVTGKSLPGEDGTQPTQPQRPTPQPSPARPARKRPPSPPPPPRRRSRCFARASTRAGLWRSGTLNQVRKLDLGPGLCGRVLRWHPGVNAMLTLYRNIVTGEPQAVQRTFLDQDAHKIGRKFTGPSGGAAAMLDPFDDVLEGLHLGEGVETCMTARQWGLRPAWALGSKGEIAKFPILNGVECLTLLQENDPEGHSQRACEACAARWHAAGREVIINTSNTGNDLNDALRGAS